MFRHPELQVTDQTYCLTQSQFTDTVPNSPSTDLIMLGLRQSKNNNNIDHTEKQNLRSFFLRQSKNNNNIDHTEKQNLRFFHNLLTAPLTVSNSYA